MPLDIAEAKKIYADLQLTELTAIDLRQKRNLARLWANFATGCEKDRHSFKEEAEIERLDQYIEEAYSQALKQLSYLSASEIEENDTHDFHEITIRLAAFYYKRNNYLKAYECYDYCLTLDDKFPLGLDTKFHQKMGQVLLVLANLELQTNTSTQANLINNEALDLARKGLTYLLQAAQKGNLEASAILGHYYNEQLNFSKTLLPLKEALLIPALQYAAENKVLRFKAEEMLSLLFKSFSQFTQQEQYYKIYTELKRHLENKYKSAISGMISGDKDLEHFMELVDDLGFPLHLKLDEEDLFAHIDMHPYLPPEQKTSLIHFLISRGFVFQSPNPYPPELSSKDYTEAKVIDELIFNRDPKLDDNLNKIILGYMGIDFNKGNHALFFAQTQRKNKRQLSIENDESNKALKQEDSQNPEGTQTPQLFSQSHSDASTQVLADTQSPSL